MTLYRPRLISPDNNTTQPDLAASPRQTNVASLQPQAYNSERSHSVAVTKMLTANTLTLAPSGLLTPHTI